jgi:hypothetical protein
MTLPDSSAICAMSNAIQRAADALAIAASAPASTRPSPSAVFSPIDQTRCVDAISVVRSGVTRPRWTAARRFHQLGGEDDVDVARHRHQRQHRRQAGRLGVGAREQLDVVDRRAGALRDAGHRGRLAQVAVLLGELDDPVGQDAAAFAADGEDRDLDGLGGHGAALRTRSERAGAHRAVASRRSRQRAPGPGSDPTPSGC